jgi:hypothetical protein
VEIQVGTPPQSYRAILDNGWEDLFLPSIKCKSEACSSHPRYDASQSKSYSPVGYPVELHYGGFNNYGYASSDTVHVAGLEIKNQVFQEATSYLPSPFASNEQIDTSLGLSRLAYECDSSTLNATSIWHNIVHQRVLPRNIFSIKLSKSPHSSGEITFGGSNRDLFEGELMTLPVTHVTDDYDHEGDDYYGLKFKSGWQVAAHSLTFGPVEFDFSGFTAVVVTSFPYIEFPRDLYDAIWEICGGHEDGDFPEIDCEMRKSLPDMIFRFGVAGNVTVVISPFDYVSEIHDEDGDTYCVLHVADDEVRDNIPKHIILGSPFLGGVYSVFDQDEATISCK